MPMCYEILNAETGERVKKKWFIAINQNSAWYPTKNFKEKTLMVYPTPEEAALRLMCNEWL